MTDRELLELAAKAAGYLETESIQSGLGFIALAVMDSEGDWTGKDWNPLTDDGDALRLAVKLKSRMGGLWIYLNSTSVGYQNRTGGMVRVHEECGTTPDAATRRAIVRAAAEIGKAMP